MTDYSIFFTNYDFKNTIANAFNVAEVQQMNLYSNGQPMQDEKVLSEFTLGERSTIDVDFGLLGGKVHGSLARAGKVKGQTPKVITYSLILYDIINIELK